MKRKAIISVSDKSGLDTLLPELAKQDFDFISTGGSAKYIREQGYAVQEVADLTGFPEMMDGRVKTLNPKILGGILARRDKDNHLGDLQEYGIPQIDLVVVNLYPFANTIEADRKDVVRAIENIDVGGPTMLRSAAKNYEFVTVLSDPSQYKEFLTEIQSANIQDLPDAASSDTLVAAKQITSLKFRRKLASEVFSRLANYDALIARYLEYTESEAFAEDDIEEREEQLKQTIPPAKAISPIINFPLKAKQALRYGENPQQNAMLFTDPLAFGTGVANAEQLHGKELSFNNLLDLDSAWRIVEEYDEKIPCVSIIKHNNPCGVAIAPGVSQAYIEALSCDTVSAFGGIVASNSTVDGAAAIEMSNLFLEAIVAPDFTEEALSILTKKKNLRILKVQSSANSAIDHDIKKISGGYLVQTANLGLFNPDDLKTVTKKEVEEHQWVDLLFAWKICKHVKSNGIVTALNGKTLGVGIGQSNRVKSVEDAVKNIDLETRGAVLASDAFFPFADNIDIAAQHHISAIIQPGGSIRDEEVIKACDDLGIAMVFTKTRHFRH